MADLASILENLSKKRSTGCVQVESPSLGTWRLYMDFGTVVNATGPSGDGDMAVAQALACGDAVTTFDASARLPEVPGTDEPLESATSTRRITYQHWTLIARSCLVVSILLFIIGPAVGLVFAVWLAVTPTASEVEAAQAYVSAPACPATSTVKDCILSERATLVSYQWFHNKIGHTDHLTLQLADGVHETDIYFQPTRDSFVPPYVYYASVGGAVRVRVFRGRITTVYAADGKGYETLDSPISGASWRNGVVGVMVIVLGPVLVIAAYLLIRGLGLRSLWRLFRNPTRPLPTYQSE